ncbi:hypothetical protein [Rhodoferax sp.]|uniref:hypothetical protein n=1 Tax=Rhodoferax sp. TaxID=50421 RepID=UPI00374D2446
MSDLQEFHVGDCVVSLFAKPMIDGTWLARVGIAQNYGVPIPSQRMFSFDNPFTTEDTALAHAREQGLRIARDPVAYLMAA